MSWRVNNQEQLFVRYDSVIGYFLLRVVRVCVPAFECKRMRDRQQEKNSKSCLNLVRMIFFRRKPV